MKFHFLFFAVFTTSISAAQQNLVLNGSLEDYSACPSGVAQITNAIGWMSFRGSPDYLSECSTSPYVMIPQNQFGYQFPFDGIAYAGVITYHYVFNEEHEFLTTQLSQPLQIGSTYFISFRTCLAVNQGTSFSLAVNHMGAKFSNTLYSELTPMPVDNNPAIDYPFFITDTVNWTLVSGWYVADSNYTYLAIGNFYNGNLTDTLHIIPNTTNGGLAYYYIDSVVVINDIGDGINTIEEIAPRLFCVPANDFCIASMGTQRIDNTGVINLLGQEVSCAMTIERDRIRIETSGLPAGSYLVKLHDHEKNWTLPLIVQH